MPQTTRPGWLAPVVLALALTLDAAAAPQTVPADAAPPGPRTGLIVGQVVDAAGVPVPEAIVSLTMPKYRDALPTTPKGRVFADAEGRYFFANLPAGDYRIQALKDGYGGGAYGQGLTSGVRQLLSLAAGERCTDGKLVLWKYGVIAGTVVDETGEPVVGVAVRALVKTIVGGRPRYGGGAYLVPTVTTDDRGMFRLAQLMPATYVVVAPSRQGTVPVQLLTGQTGDVRSEFSHGDINEVAPVGQPRTLQVGDVAVLTSSRTMIPPPASPAGRMETYRTTYYPAATTPAAGTQIALASGETKTGLTITMRPVPAVRISGRLVSPDGTPPAPMALALVNEATDNVDGDLIGEAFETATGLSDASGRFTLLDVPAGEYVLRRSSGSLQMAAQSGRPALWMTQHVSVGATDISDLTVALRPPLKVDGRIEFRGSRPDSALGTPPFSFIQFDSAFGGSVRFLGLYPDPTSPVFSGVAANGQYVALVPERVWFVKSVTVNGEDATDRPFDLQTDSVVTVTFTDQPSKVSGVVKDARGVVSPNSVVLAFPADPERWIGYGPSPRRFKSAGVSQTGTYTFPNLPAGDYWMIAVDDGETAGWMDPKRLEVLARQATKVTIVEGQPKTADLAVQVIR